MCLRRLGLIRADKDLPTELEYYVSVNTLHFDSNRTRNTTSLRTRGNIGAGDAQQLLQSGIFGPRTNVGAFAGNAQATAADKQQGDADQKKRDDEERTQKEEEEQQKKVEEERKKLEKKRKQEEKREAEKKKKEEEANCPFNKGAKFAASLWKDIGAGRTTIGRLGEPAHGEALRSTASGLADKMKDSVEKMTESWTEITNAVEKQALETLGIAMDKAVGIVREHLALTRMADALLKQDEEEGPAAKKSKKG
jgi:hypothetical protein